ncbi:MAG TPA: 16S rRNA (guanine(527)-N(7))-methyltransferase RsmG [Gammaproteobacteria bacterium]|nr:16S rRNA (guanine(527)-N(7))-methyltransferase RsmG [Gammaproteobacteria bacterium]HBF07755.1 16S rRNA (guanine(527)-N(7))-methyltransferase RsmG [Gammaproteobacteria bacterium]HCK93347.1 16S rRNA (guanine(527)-N(7))-methyltransferase RsmG [Gammaproteobacteria bacterium]|tara:strand:+ start:334 stop:1038 length:705 start_codon:yes stop_codon:yes gene_type:complete
MIPETSKKILARGIEELGLDISEQQIAQLHQYLNLLAQWNKTFNLTAIRNYDDMVVHHLLDSFAIQPFVESHLKETTGEQSVFGGNGGQCLDIGSGAGVPGIPMAILNPSLHWTLVDSNGKKARFLRHVVRDARLSNVTVVQGRIEELDLGEPKRPLMVTARALASTAEIVELIRHFLQPNDRVLLMKGLNAADEIKEEMSGFAPFSVHEVKVPFLEATRYLLATEFEGNAEEE